MKPGKPIAQNESKKKGNNTAISPYLYFRSQISPSIIASFEDVLLLRNNFILPQDLRLSPFLITKFFPLGNTPHRLSERSPIRTEPERTFRILPPPSKDMPLCPSFTSLPLSLLYLSRFPPGMPRTLFHLTAAARTHSPTCSNAAALPLMNTAHHYITRHVHVLYVVHTSF